jgi:erythromycin esterase-like protein
VVVDSRPPVHALRESLHPLKGGAGDWDPLLELVGETRVVLLGEGTHGTHEFYRARAEITKRLIVEKGFRAVAVEADWPDAWRVHRFVTGADGADADEDATEALADFRRFPQWMWRNADVLDFVGWLRAWNDERAADQRAGFYGLDLYSLHASAAAVLAHLDRVDPAAARRARERYGCFEGLSTEELGLGVSRSCEDEVVAQLLELQERRFADHDEGFAALMNARVVKSAEAYYRTMFAGHVRSWNLRDRHMAEILEHVRERAPRVVVWAHNSHLGDARHTEMGRWGELNVGQLVRERYGGDALLVGFTTHTGTVTAASDWGGAAERMRVRPSIPGSYERMFHETGVPRFFLSLRDLGEAAGLLRAPLLERAIGVVYRPRTELQSHYFQAALPSQFDAVIHYDETRAVEPLERTPAWGTIPAHALPDLQG